LFRELSGAVERYGGFVEKFVGDAVMAVFGAPFPQDDHADRAVVAASVMHELQAGINTRWEADGLPPFGLGLGLSTGEAAAALLGSAERLEYTLVGDTVNLCQRLQQLAGKGETVASEATVRALKAAVETILLGAQQVKGRETPVVAYKIVCRDSGPAAQANPASNSTSRMGGLCQRARAHWPYVAYAKPSRPRTRRSAPCAVWT
jgi:class 3 adenylate cyclase